MTKRSIKRFIPLLLSVALLLTSFSLVAFSQENELEVDLQGTESIDEILLESILLPSEDESDRIDNTLLQETENLISVEDETEINLQETTESSDDKGNVANSQDLEDALSSGLTTICIAEDFEVDRTFYVVGDVTIYSEGDHTLTRAADFAGDLFVVGEDKEGNTTASTLAFGKPEQSTGTLALDGNKGNTTVDVTGSAIFVCGGSSIDLHSDITIKNFKKVGNERALDTKHGVSYTERVGGAGIILAKNSTANIYGGNYCNNETNDIGEEGESATLSFHGGFIYNFGTLNIYGGTFESNHAARGGFAYNYRTMNIYRGEIKNNSASNLGGAIYMPNSTSAITNIGGENDVVTPGVNFIGNTSADHAGAIYARNKTNIKNATFSNNTSGGNGGAIAAYTTIMTISDSVFEENNATSHGAAIFLSDSNEKEALELTVSNSVFKKNTTAKNGGSIYAVSGARIYGNNVEFANNNAASGGAIYSTGSSVELNGASMKENVATGYGGAITIYTNSTVTLNDIKAEGNSGSRGGFLYSEASQLDMYNSEIIENKSGGVGGAVAFYDNAVSNVYNTTFENNSSVTNGGAITAYTAGTKTVLHTCTFKNNSATNYGGAMYASGKALVDIYNASAIGNSAGKGGAFYITTTGTVVTLVGATVSENVATDSAPIIWGNSTGAKLYIDKSKFVDSDIDGELDSDYWSDAIVNKLTVSDIEGSVPPYLDYGNESYDNMPDAVDVDSAEELEKAINEGKKHIRIVSDFEIDRTFFITEDVTIFSTAPRILTRSRSFSGDIFVVGENSLGQGCIILGTDPVLTLGNPSSTTENLLVIDGNRDNMNVDVNGTVIFITDGATAELYDNVSIINCYKVSNDRTYGANYKFSRANRVGGPVAIVENGTINIYGGNYINNGVRDEVIIDGDEDDSGRDSTLGGVIYNNNNVGIYGGHFEGNYAARGGIIYNYRIVKVDGATFVDNYASASGGVFYMPNAAVAHIFIGSESGDKKTVFKNNSANNHGGAIYSSSLSGLVIYGNTSFEENHTVTGSGGAVAVYGQFTVRDTDFISNTAALRGGAVYVTKSSDDDDTRYATYENCLFKNNEAIIGGALSIYASSMEFSEGAIAYVNNSEFIENYARKTTSTSPAGGAVAIDRQAKFIATDCSFESNGSDGEAGAIYVTSKGKVEIYGGSIKNNYTNVESGSHGGAVSVRSSKFILEDTEVYGNTSYSNGGAIYVSYVSSTDVNSTVTLKNATFENNASNSYGGAIYVTRQTVDEVNDNNILKVYDTIFKNNSSEKSGGVICLAANVNADFYNSDFVSNKAVGDQGGAVYTTGAILNFEECSFTDNKAKTTGGAISIPGSAKVILYKPTASGNEADDYGGFLYSEDAELKVFGGNFDSNSSKTAGGAMAFFGDAISSVYDAEFVSNLAGTNGGALFIYTDNTKTILHSNKFISNVAANYGGAIEMSKVSLVDIYDVVGKDNSAKYGGFIYETSAGTTVTLVGTTVSGNTATAGGNIIWGNTYNADLYIDKTKYTDLDVTGVLDESYWSSAIVNKLTVIEQEGAVPEKETYQPEFDDTQGSVTKDPVPVTDVLSLGLSSSDGYINSVYNALPRLDNSSNFMSKNTIVYPDINGVDVTVDTFVYPEYGKADNMNVGLGLMVYQAILYKEAHPDEEVYIDVSSYRFSIEAAININRNSRYFGYMRNLVGMDYDEFGFVRISYLLVTAAKMGIHVNVIGHIDAYPISESDPNLGEYFTRQLNDPCDPSYVENGVIGDYLDFTHCQWSLDSKGGTDMMHTKMCAVSHYLDMNGEAHYNAVFSSSSNLDGIRSDAANGNWKLQTGSIISDHKRMYDTSVNYLRLVAKYGKYKEGIIEFHDVINRMGTEQIDLILAGKESEIPEGTQIVYLGGEHDKVFELYFTPFGGSILEWSELYNPYCKYLRKLYNSEDSIIFTWNAAEYSSAFSLAMQMEDIIVESFQKNKNPENRFYGVMNTFDGTRLDNLVEGKDVGYVSVNQRPFGQVHNKDVQVSYVENGQRYYVTLLNSLNLHSGSMYYQSNFLIVIKETECKENGVFFTIADNSTLGIVEHKYGEEKTYYPSNSEDGYYYKECENCDKIIITGTAHHAGGWITHSVLENGNELQKKLCVVCGDILASREYHCEVGSESIDEYKEQVGKTFNSQLSSGVRIGSIKTPHTIEAKIHLPKNYNGRGGVIVGNYEKIQDGQFNLEIDEGGKVKLYYTEYYKYMRCVFDPDIRSDKPVHIAVTVEGYEAKLYVDGVLSDIKTLLYRLPESVENMRIGVDNRPGNQQYFKGTIYSVALFSDIRTPLEITRDTLFVARDTEDLIYTTVFSHQGEMTMSSLDEFGTKLDEEGVKVESVSSKAPHTIETRVMVSDNADSGVIVGNYGFGNKEQLNVELYLGQVRLLFEAKGKTFDHIFSTEIKRDEYTDIAITVDGSVATLYINGEEKESIDLDVTYPTIIEDLRIGADYQGSSFSGKVAYVHLYSDVRTYAEINKDRYIVFGADCDILASYYFGNNGILNNTVTPIGQNFTQNSSIDVNSIKAPRTFEALVALSESYYERGGVIFGNYDGDTPNQVNLEIYENGRVRLFYTNNWAKEDCIFNTDIRSEEPVHVTVTIEENIARLYLNGNLVESKLLTVEYPTEIGTMKLGGDNRTGNPQYFKGTIYAATLYNDTRSADEIKKDSSSIDMNDSDIILSGVLMPSMNSSIDSDGKAFTSFDSIEVPDLSNAPATVEAWIRVPYANSERAGVIFGNYDGGTQDQLNIEIYEGGRVRLFYISDRERFDHIFSQDIRSNDMTHIAVTVSDNVAMLYVNGRLSETAELTQPYTSAVDSFRIGGDNRFENTQYFKGTLYSLTLFDSPRSNEEILRDMNGVLEGEEGLLYQLEMPDEICPSGDGIQGHINSKWIEDIAPEEYAHGIYHSVCSLCGKTLSYKALQVSGFNSNELDLSRLGKTFDSFKEIIPVGGELNSTPLTFEVLFKLDPTFNDRAGVLVGNYTANGKDVMNLEIYNNGTPRFYYRNNHTAYTIQFSTDVRSTVKTHIAVTIDGLTANLYKNGVLAESVQMTAEVAEVKSNFCIGGDARTSNYQNFKGTIYAVHLFDDVRSAEEIANDSIFVQADDSILYSQFLKN